MKKLILSTFAVSLTLLSPLSFCQSEAIDDFLGLESEILPEMKGPQKFTSQEMHQAASGWKVSEKQVEVDTGPLKGQSYSLIPWSEQDTEQWLNVEQWMVDRKVKDKSPDWKLRLRDVSNQELVGKILQCKGDCLIYRGTRPVAGQYLSRLVEGDEIKTTKDSVAWIYLMDGTLVRMSPETSLTLQEINFSKKEVLYLARLNDGHIFWHSRNQDEMKLETDPETDSLSLPLMIREANQEFYERQIYQTQSDKAYVSSFFELNDQGITGQTLKVNQLRKDNNSIAMPPSKVLMVTPNGTFISQQGTFDLFYNNGGEAHFKQRSSRLGNVKIQYRGYLNEALFQTEQETWYTVATNGRNINQNSAPTSDLLIPELITKRIKSIELAREIWLAKFTLPIMMSLGDSQKLAMEFGYKLWNEDLALRAEYLLEYFRRVETTHLQSIENLVTRLEAKGETVVKTPSSVTYQGSLNHYLLGLKKRYSNKQMQVREMNDLQYYVWILKNGKL